MWCCLVAATKDCSECWKLRQKLPRTARRHEHATPTQKVYERSESSTNSVDIKNLLNLMVNDYREKFGTQRAEENTEDFKKRMDSIQSVRVVAAHGGRAQI